jgi:hypothetical protein
MAERCYRPALVLANPDKRTGGQYAAVGLSAVIAVDDVSCIVAKMDDSATVLRCKAVRCAAP